MDRAAVAAALAVFPRQPADRPDLRPAAVAIAIVDAAAFLLTRRSAGLRAHASQWALPGGRLDEGESAVDAARRELHEELGLAAAEETVLGALDDYPTRSGFVITPVVLWVDRPGAQISPQAAEVAEVYQVPLAELAVEPRFHPIPESSQPVIQLPLLGHLIHAPTAAVLYQFAEVVLRGRITRVAHYEQPVFAWR